MRDVEPESPAAQGGIPRGAVIVRIDNFPIRTSTDLVVYIADAHPGDSVDLSYYIGDAFMRKTFRLTSVQIPVPENQIASARNGDSRRITTRQPIAEYPSDEEPLVLPHQDPDNAKDEQEPALLMPGAGPDIHLLKRTVDQLERHVQALQDQLNETNQLLQEIKLEIGKSEKPASRE